MKRARARSAGAGADSPFLRARLEWNDRFHGLARGKRNWQIVASALLLSNTVLAGALAWLSTQSRVTPFVVEVDRLGQAAAFGPAEKLRRTDERLLRYQLGTYVRDLRTVLSDAEAQKELLTRAYAYTRGPAVAFLNQHFLEQNPFELARRRRVGVETRSILRLSDETWQIQWLETARSADGRTEDSRGWQAVLTVEVDPPSSTEAILTNPLGLYVTEISWTPTL
jgi:type IV secretion system protein VirB5